MLRVSRADGRLPRAQDAGVGRQDLRSSGGCVVIRSGGWLPGGYPPVPVGLPGGESPGQAPMTAGGAATQDCRRSGGDQPGGSGPSSGGLTLRLHLVLIPPGTRGLPHLHPGREAAGYIVSGEAEVWHGAGLIRRSVVRAGDFIYIAPGTPHLAVNRGDVTSIAVVACPSPAGSVPVELPRHLAGLLSYPVGYAG
jgi:uncharacterized RmlC-like cupin family protein